MFYARHSSLEWYEVSWNFRSQLIYWETLTFGDLQFIPGEYAERIQG